MSQENVEISRRSFKAFSRTFTEGTDDLYALLDPDVEWIPINALLDGTTYRGHEGVRQWIEDVKRDWAVFEAKPEDFLDLGDDRVLVLGSWRARGRGGDELLDFPQAAWLEQVREGRIVRMQTFTERKEALEAAGLRE
jgi:ketosteroid isomerase-like protein